MDQWEALLPDVKSGDDQFKVFEDEGQDHVDVRYVPALNKVKLYIRSEAKLIFIPIAQENLPEGPSFIRFWKEAFIHWLDLEEELGKEFIKLEDLEKKESFLDPLTDYLYSGGDENSKKKMKIEMYQFLFYRSVNCCIRCFERPTCVAFRCNNFATVGAFVVAGDEGAEDDGSICYIVPTCSEHSSAGAGDESEGIKIRNCSVAVKHVIKRKEEEEASKMKSNLDNETLTPIRESDEEDRDDDSKDEDEDDESMDEDEDDDPILDFLMENGQCQLYEKIQTKLKSLPEGQESYLA